MNTLLKWAIYARKSTEDKQIQSIPDQLKIFTEVAQRSQFKVLEVITDEKSAKKPGVRPGFLKLLQKIEKGEVNAILCWKLNRLARNLEEGGKIIQLLQTGVIQCIKVVDREYYPKDNVLLLAVEMGMANQEIRDLGVSTMRGMTSKAEKGWYPCIAPIGYRNSNTGKQGEEKILTDKLRFPIIQHMWRLLLSGNHSVAEIHRLATREWKLDTLKKRRTGGTRPAISNVYRIFQNPFYAGIFKYKGKIYKGKHEAMISMSEFQMAQVILKRETHAKHYKHEMAYTGIIKCANCGSSITATKKKKKIKRTGETKYYTYYHCTRKVGELACHAPAITLMDLENQIVSYLESCSISSRFYAVALNALETNRHERDAAYDSIYAHQQRQVQVIQQKRDKLLVYLMNETISEAEYNSLKLNLELEYELEKGKLDRSQDLFACNTLQVKNGLHFCKGAIAALRNGDLVTRGAILRHLGSNHRLDNKKLYIETSKWFLAIKDSERMLAAQNHRLELEKASGRKPKNENSENFVFRGALLDSVRTELEKVEDVTIPDLSLWANQDLVEDQSNPVSADDSLQSE